MSEWHRINWISYFTFGDYIYEYKTGNQGQVRCITARKLIYF
ncbi:MAG: hypothetical protein Ct9H300mP7_6870 [Verrucomicrobiota bacterium]|nr:MAG: hypothetical protein Ct9H300mP7_6870 [Verrucomicrobiota bacterium]